MRRLARSSRAATAATVILAVAAVLSACGSSGDGPGETISFAIPAGAGKLIEAGRDVPGVPQRIEGSVGDTVEVTNDDSELHVVSGFPVSPDQTLRIPLNRAGTYEVECSAHDDRSLTMVVSP